MSTPSPERRSQEGAERIARNVGFAFAGQALTVVFTAALTVLLVRTLEPAGYGLFALAVSIGALLELPSDFGISSSTARFIAERRGDRSAVARLVADGLRLKLIAGLLVSTVLALAAGPIANAYDEPGLAAPLRVVAVALFGQGLMVLYANVLAAQGRTSLYLRIVGSKAVVELTASATLVLFGAGVMGAATGRAIGYAFGGAAGVLTVLRLLGRGSVTLRSGSVSRRGEIFRYARAVIVVDGALTLFTHLDVLLIGAILGPAAVGVFEAPLRLVTPLSYPAQAVATGLAPRLVGSVWNGADAFGSALRYLLIVQSAAAALVFAWAQPIVDIALGPGFSESADVLRALTPFILLSGVAPLVATGANYLGQAGRRVPIAIAAVVLNLAIDLALISEIGVIAGGIGTSAAFALYVPAHVWLCHRALGFRLRPVVVTFVRTLMAAAAMVGVLLAAPSLGFGVATAVAGGAGGLLAYTVVLVFTGELSRDDVAAARSAWRRARGTAA